MTSAPRPIPITKLGEANDRFRENLLRGLERGHRMVATQAVLARGPLVIQEVLHRVLTFPSSSFRESFDPYGDRDFIVIEHLRCRYWAKIDPYDLSMEGCSPDPADDAVTLRVMTLMLPDEY